MNAPSALQVFAPTSKLKTLGSSRFFLTLQLLLSSFCSVRPSKPFTTAKTDLLALISFKSLISSDPLGILSSWNGSVHHCLWPGIKCGSRHPDRVTALVLSSSHLSEYGMGGQASTQGDVYSYGILLLEIFTGLSPTAERFTDGLNLLRLVEMSFPNKIMEIVDHKLILTNGEKDNAHEPGKIYECLLLVTQCALMCCKESPNERISIKEVAKALNSAREKLLA